MSYAIVMLFMASVADCYSTVFPVSRADQNIVSDATNRWSKKFSSTESFERDSAGGVPIVISIFDERCVVFKLSHLGDVGGAPVYCYELNSDKLTRSKDNVE